MAENTIDNLSIQVTASAENAARVFDRLASSAGRLRGAASGAVGGMEDMAQGARDAGTEMQKAGEQSGSAALKIRGVGKDAKTAGDNAKKGASGLATFWQSLKRIAYYRFIRSIIRDIGEAFNYGITNLYQWSSAVDGKFAASMNTIKTATNYLKNSFAAMVSPLINALAPALDFIIDKVVEVLNWFNQLFAALSGAKTYTVAKKVASTWADAGKNAAGSAKKAADDIKRTILGFDEINKLVDNNNKGTGSGSGSSKPGNAGSVLFEEKSLTGGFKGFSDALENALKDKLSRIGLIVSGASLAIGAILALSGANIPLGIGLMIAGAAGIAATLSWNVLGDETYSALKKIIGIASMGSLAIGLILALTGANVPLGVGLIAAGAVGLASTINWAFLGENVYKSLKTIIGFVTLGAVAVGAILALTGVNVPLGIGLIAGGIAGAAANIDWNSLGGSVYGSLKKIISVVSLGSVAVGAILALTGVAIPLGIGLMAAGIAGTAVSLNWHALEEDTYGSLKRIIRVASMGAFAVGVILALSGVALPLGIALMAAGAGSLLSMGATEINWDTISDKIKMKLDAILEMYEGFKTKAIKLFDNMGQKLNGFFNDIADGWNHLFGGGGTKNDKQYIIPLTGPDMSGFTSNNGIASSGQYTIPLTDPGLTSSGKSSAGLPSPGSLAMLGYFVGEVKNAAEEVNSTFDNMANSTGKSMDKLVDNIQDGKDNALGITWIPVGENVVNTMNSGLDNKTPGAINKVNNLVGNMYSTADSKSFTPIGSSMVSDISNGVSSNSWSATNAISNVTASLYNTALNRSFNGVGSNIMTGIYNGIVSGWDWLTNTVKNLANNLFNAAKDILGIHSPSRVFADGIGKQIDMGIVEGINDSTSYATDAIARLGKAMSAEMNGYDISASMYKMAGGSMDYQPNYENYQTYNEADDSNRNDVYMSILRDVRQLLMEINDKDTTVEVSTSSINKAQTRMNRRIGRTVAPVGT